MANQVTVGALFQEGTSQVRPPNFNGQHFSYWKVQMKITAKPYDVKVWCVIKKGNYPLTAAAQPPVDPEDVDEYTNEQMTVVQVNAKTRNLLYNAISGEEYEKISNCDTAKEMWDKLEVTYEGTSKVKETHINMLVHDYELFQMKEEEFIEEIFARFSKIIGDLKAFDLIAFEKTYLKKKNQEEKKKTVAFKATTERPKNDIDDDPEALEEEIAMVSRNVDSLMRRGFNKNKSFGSWSDEKSSEHEEIANLCFMTILDNDMNEYAGCWTDEDTSDDESKENTENCFMACGETSEVRSYKSDRCNELQDILDLTLKESQKMLNELRRLNREKDWELKLEVCEIERDVLQDEVQELQMQLNGMHFVSLIFQDGFGNPKTNLILVELTSKDPSKLGYLKESDKNLLKEVTKINGGSVKFGDDSRGKIVGTDTVPFTNNCEITDVYLVDGLNYNLPRKRYGNVYILDGIENLDSYICLESISDDPLLWHKKLSHTSIHLIEKLSKHD
ncbi:uncharacterized protein [Nicotiana tomentosiformis]|uniref:uncharacterized protein n=1 Tax=Nicotiana tomentosiformis TaxID=4098 RepID=UPI00388C7494